MSAPLDDLAWLDATALAHLIQIGELSPLEAVDHAIARIEAFNPRLNAVITPLFDQARQRAVAPDLPAGPFRGVPLLLKDYLCQTAGDPYYEGMGFLRDLDWRAEADTFLAQKFRAAGFIILGKTNLPEQAMLPVTEPAAWSLRSTWRGPSRTAIVSRSRRKARPGGCGCSCRRIPSTIRPPGATAWPSTPSRRWPWRSCAPPRPRLAT